MLLSAAIVQYQFSWQFLLLTLELLSHAIFLLCSRYPLGVIRSLVLQQLVELLLSPKHGRGNTRTHLIHRIFHGLLGRSRAAGGGMLSRGWRWWRGNLNFHPWLRMSLQISMSRHFPAGISSIKNGFFLHVRTVSYKTVSDGSKSSPQFITPSNGGNRLTRSDCRRFEEPWLHGLQQDMQRFRSASGSWTGHPVT